MSWKLALGVAVVVIAYAITMGMDHRDDADDRDFYCEMVGKWEAEAERGVPKSLRTGWPPYDGRCD